VRYFERFSHFTRSGDEVVRYSYSQVQKAMDVDYPVVPGMGTKSYLLRALADLYVVSVQRRDEALRFFGVSMVAYERVVRAAFSEGYYARFDEVSPDSDVFSLGALSFDLVGAIESGLLSRALASMQAPNMKIDGHCLRTAVFKRVAEATASATHHFCASGYDEKRRLRRHCGAKQ
jgi:hypothetical protein